MKAFHYDIEGDILSVTFADATGQANVGVELSDNIVVYYNPETLQPLKLILVSYRAMVEASATTAIELDGLERLPKQRQTAIANMLGRKPLTTFLQLEEKRFPSATYLPQLFTPTAWQSVV